MLDPETIKQIDELKREKPKHWKEKIRGILHKWHVESGSYHREYHAFGPSDKIGRRIHRTDGCPIYDRMDDDSGP